MSPTGETPAAEPTKRNWHVIVGSNGMCECGVKADGTVVRCGELHRAEVEALAKRLSGADGGCRHGVAWDVHCCNCHSGFIFDRNHQCPATPSAGPDLREPVTALLRDVGTVLDVARRRSDPDAEDRQMLNRLAQWEEQLRAVLALVDAKETK